MKVSHRQRAITRGLLPPEPFPAEPHFQVPFSEFFTKRNSVNLNYCQIKVRFIAKRDAGDGVAVCYGARR